jgi:hypothetical protein
MTINVLGAAMRAAAIEHRCNLPLTGKHRAAFGLVANNQVVALVAVPATTPSWGRTRCHLESNLPVFAVPDRDAKGFVAAWAARDLSALARFRVPLRGAAPSL